MSTYYWHVDSPSGYGNRMGRYKTRRERDFIDAHLPEGARTVLDLGGASGRFAVGLGAAGYQVTVVDIAEDALRRLEATSPTNVQVVCSDFLAFEAKEPFDVVVAIEAIQSFADTPLTEVFERVRAALKPGGTFVFTELNADSWHHRLHELRSKKPRYLVAGPQGYEAALSAAGFRMQEMLGFVWMPLPVSSDSRLVTVFAWIESTLRLGRFRRQSPWLLVAARA